MFGGVSKIRIANTFNELVEMDIVDYGDYADFLHIRDAFSRFHAIIFREARKWRTNGRNSPVGSDSELVIVARGSRNYRDG